MKKEPEILTKAQQKLKRKQAFIRVVKFVLFSCTAGIIQIVAQTILMEVAKAPYWAAYLTGLILSVLYNFTINRKFTFKSANNVPIAMVKVAIFYAIFTPLSTWGGNELTKIGVNEYIVMAGSMIANFVLEFLYDQFFVFRNSINTNELGKKDVSALEKAGEEKDSESPATDEDISKDAEENINKKFY